MLIMYLLGMLFHPANVSSLVFALELKSCSALCEGILKTKVGNAEYNVIFQNKYSCLLHALNSGVADRSQAGRDNKSGSEIFLRAI